MHQLLVLYVYVKLLFVGSWYKLNVNFMSYLFIKDLVIDTTMHGILPVIFHYSLYFCYNCDFIQIQTLYIKEI